MLRTGKGLSSTKYTQSLSSATPNMARFIDNWDAVEVFTEEVWKCLENDLNVDIDPTKLMNSLVKGAEERKNLIEGLKGLESGNSSLLRIAETRAQNRIFEYLTESQKLWISANSGETQSWTKLLPLFIWIMR